MALAFLSREKQTLYSWNFLPPFFNNIFIFFNITG